MPKSELTALTLLGVFVAGPLAGRTFPGGEPWTSLLTGFTLLLILFAFDHDTQRTVWQSVAFAAGCGFCVTVALPGILQYLGIIPVGQISSGVGLPHAAVAVEPFPWTPLIWLAATVLFCIVDRSRMSGQPTTAPVPVFAPSPVPVQVPAAVPVAAPASFVRQTPVSDEVRTEPIPAPYAAPPQAMAATAAPVETVRPAPPIEPAPLYEPPPAAPVAPVFEERTAPQSPPPPPLPNAVPFPTGVGKPAVIYLNLVGEGLPVLRSVQAEHVGKDYYLIVEPVPAGERWQFQPGQIVRAQKKNLSNGKALVAVEEAPRAS